MISLNVCSSIHHLILCQNGKPSSQHCHLPHTCASVCLFSFGKLFFSFDIIMCKDQSSIWCYSNGQLLTVSWHWGRHCQLFSILLLKRGLFEKERYLVFSKAFTGKCGSTSHSGKLCGDGVNQAKLL